MTGAFLVIIAAIASASAVFVAVLASQRPDEGWIAWFRGTFRAWRRDELTWADTDIEDGEVGGLGALYLMSEPGNAYTSAEELAGTFTSRPRETAPSAPAAPPAQHHDRRAVPRRSPARA